LARQKFFPAAAFVAGSGITIATSGSQITISSSGGGGGGGGGGNIGVASVTIGSLSTITTMYVATGRVRVCHLYMLVLSRTTSGALKVEGAEYIQAFVAARYAGGATVDRHPGGGAYFRDALIGSEFSNIGTLPNTSQQFRLVAGATVGYTRVQINVSSNLPSTGGRQAKVYYLAVNQQA
jgi:hypothetical protein